MQESILNHHDAPVHVPLADGELRYWPAAFDGAEADDLFRQLRSRIAWHGEELLIFGKLRAVPRLLAWHGDADAHYRYSGLTHLPKPWTAELLQVRQRVEQLTGHRCNSVLLNLYRSGNDGMGWHADDEPELGRNPVIVSVSLGAVRRFRLKHRTRKDQSLTLPLGHGSLLLMSGTTQHHWVHALPKTATHVGERINLTFRQVLPRTT